MMESSNLNLDHLHHQEELHGSSSSSSSLAAPSFHFVGTNHEYWNQDLLLNINSGDFIPDTNGVLLSSSKDFMRLSHEMPVVQHPGFQPLGSNEELYMNNHSSHQVHLSKIKEELSDFFPKLSGINLRDHSNLQDYHLMPSHVKNELDQINGLQPPVGHDLGFDPMSLGCFGRRSFSMVLPTANISNSNQPPLQYSSCLGMDFQALDLLATARFGRALCQPSLDNIPLLREDLAYGLGQLQEQAQGPSASHHKISSSVSGVTEARRANNSLEYKASEQAAVKKPRFESRSSFTPFKVRKEKLGDRIAALQQLVAPFGKTDTASVLMEAIGYIKFLQDQVETLSVPYMRSSNNKKLRTSQGASGEDKDEPKPDLRSRGLCLVPLSCMSYVANEIGGVWSPPNYRGGT